MRRIIASSDICSCFSSLIPFVWKGNNAVKVKTLDAIKKAFEIVGIEFIGTVECRVELLFKYRGYLKLFSQDKKLHFFTKIIT